MVSVLPLPLFHFEIYWGGGGGGGGGGYDVVCMLADLVLEVNLKNLSLNLEVEQN